MSPTEAIRDRELLATFRGHGVDRESAAHFRGRLERRLLINRCDNCGHFEHPALPVCPVCWSRDLTATEVSGNGTIHLVMFLHQGPRATGVTYENPHPVVTVELDEQPGLRLTATTVGVERDDIVIGRRVRLTWFDRDGTPTPAFELQ